MKKNIASHNLVSKLMTLKGLKVVYLNHNYAIVLSLCLESEGIK